VFFSSLTFVLGFSTVFVALGAGASAIGQFVRSYMDILSVVGGVIIIVRGVHVLGVFRIGLRHRQARMEVEPQGRPGRPYLMGLTGLGWTPHRAGAVSGPASPGRATRWAPAFCRRLLPARHPVHRCRPLRGPFMRWMRRYRSHLASRRRWGALVVTGVLCHRPDHHRLLDAVAVSGLAQLG
jgi:cytochrome c-type biogenesis protein